MSVTQDYKILTLTHSEHSATRHALMCRMAQLEKQIGFFEPLGTHTSLVSELKAELADVQAATVKALA